MKQLVIGIALLAVLAAHTAEFKLEAADFSGGELCSVGNGRAAVFLPGTATRQDKVRAAFPEVPGPGCYLLTLELYGQPDGFSPNVVFEFDSASRLALSGFFLPLRGGSFVLRAGVVLASQASGLSLSFDRLRGTPGVGLISLKLTSAELDEVKELPLFVESRLDGGELLLPGGLPYGVYQFQFPCPLEVLWQVADGSFTTPFARTTRIAGAPQRGVVKGDALGGCFVRAERYLPRSAKPQFDGVVMQTFDLERIESGTLKLAGTEEPPGIAAFPGNLPIALVTSWDDGQAFDHQLTEILNEYGVRGTLAMNHHSKVIPDLKILKDKGMEIASHSWSHPFLYLLTPEHCRAEGEAMRAFLESRIDSPVISFVHPFDHQPSYDRQGDYVIRTLRESGYWMGRGTKNGRNTVDSMDEPLAWRPDFHFMAGAERTARRLAEARSAPPGEVIYIWGHSYELAGDGEAKLRAVLETVCRQPDLWYATQGEFSVWRFLRSHWQCEATDHPGVFRVSAPWIHPALRTVPLVLTLPEGCSGASWNGEELQVDNGCVSLYFTPNN